MYNKQKAIFLTEKEKYAKHLETNENNIQANYMQAPIDREQAIGKNIPLGKYVTQMERTNPLARAQLKEMLEFQMAEK